MEITAIMIVAKTSDGKLRQVLTSSIQGLDDYNAGLYAAFEARDLLDFAVAGTWMKYINQIIPFSNAAIQGIKKI